MGCTNVKALGNIDDSNLKPSFDKLKVPTAPTEKLEEIHVKEQPCPVYPADIVDALCTLECVPGQHLSYECLCTPWSGNVPDSIKEQHGEKSLPVLDGAKETWRIAEQ